MGLSRTALAKAVAAEVLPFHQPTIQHIENAERPVRIDEAVVMIEILRMNRAGSVGLDEAVEVDSEVSLTHLLDESLWRVKHRVTEYLQWREEIRERPHQPWLTLNTVLVNYEEILAELGVVVDEALTTRACIEADNVKKLIDETSAV